MSTVQRISKGDRQASSEGFIPAHRPGNGVVPCVCLALQQRRVSSLQSHINPTAHQQTGANDLQSQCPFCAW